jgi:hypothetical protein
VMERESQVETNSLNGMKKVPSFSSLTDETSALSVDVQRLLPSK